MRSAGNHQLNFAFADSPQGGKDAAPPGQPDGKAHLLLIAKGTKLEDPATGEVDADELMERITAPANLAKALLNVARLKRSVNPRTAAKAAWCGKAIWPRSNMPGVTRAYRNVWFHGRLFCLRHHWLRHYHPPHGRSQVRGFSLTCEIPSRRAGCVAHKSGSVRGVAGQPAAPTRRSGEAISFIQWVSEPKATPSGRRA